MLFRKWSFRAIFVGYSTRSGLIFGALPNFGAPSRIRPTLQKGTSDEVSIDFWALWRTSGDLFGGISSLAAPVTSSFRAQKIPLYLCDFHVAWMSTATPTSRTSLGPVLRAGRGRPRCFSENGCFPPFSWARSRLIFGARPNCGAPSRIRTVLQ